MRNVSVNVFCMSLTILHILLAGVSSYWIEKCNQYFKKLWNYCKASADLMAYKLYTVYNQCTYGHDTCFTFYLSRLIRSMLSQSHSSLPDVITDLWEQGKAVASRGFLKNASPHGVQHGWAFPRLTESMRTTLPQCGLVSSLHLPSGSPCHLYDI